MVQQEAGDAFAVSKAGGDLSDSTWLLRRAFWSAEDICLCSDESPLGRLDSGCLTTAFNAHRRWVLPQRWTGTGESDRGPSRQAGGVFEDRPAGLKANQQQLVGRDD